MNFGSIFGFDISTYQDSDQIVGHVDFQKMRAFGASFVIIKVGQGLSLDVDFPTNWKNSKGVLPRGAYWFYDPRIDPGKQANLCIAALKVDPPEGRVWLDLEYTWTGAYTFMSDWLTFLQRVELNGFRVGIYTGNWWWQPNVTDKGLSVVNFSRYVTWLAQYSNAFTEQPRGLKVPMIWQDGTPAVGLAAGVESKEIDHNRWNDDYDFSTEWGAVPTPPGDTNDMTTILVTKALTGLNMRSAPDAGAANVLGQLLTNDILICDQEVTGKASDGFALKFSHIKAAFRGGVRISLPSGELWAAMGNTYGYQALIAWYDAPTGGGVDLGAVKVSVSAPISLTLSDGTLSRTFSGTVAADLT